MNEPFVFEATMSVEVPNHIFVIKIPVAGQEQPREYKFEAYGDPGAGGDFALVAGLITLPNGKEGADLNAIKRAFQRCFLPESFALFEEMLTDHTVRVPTPLIGDIYRKLMSLYAGGHPTSPPSNS